MSALPATVGVDTNGKCHVALGGPFLGLHQHGTTEFGGCDMDYAQFTSTWAYITERPDPSCFVEYDLHPEDGEMDGHIDTTNRDERFQYQVEANAHLYGVCGEIGLYEGDMVLAYGT